MRKHKEPSIPAERSETIRQKIISVLEGQTLSAKDISGHVGISEKEVYGHLEHIRRTMNRKDHDLNITPAECRKCGFVFRKRERLKKPGKCPVCRNDLIQEPFFSI
ncbi:MAG: transcriptional regulator [Nitrospirae bacterium]|nr:transcriptional regulator [Nitrospirota bacterium]